MKRIISVLLALSLVVSFALSLTACGEPKDDGAEISVYLGDEIYDFDPTEYYVDSNAAQIMSLLYEPLFTLNKNGKLKTGGVAKKYDVDEEECTIVIELRETYWSDGTRVKAEDFVYAWRNVLLEPNNANPAAVLLYDIENAAEIKNCEITSVFELGAQASGIYELTIKYREGADYMQLLKNLAAVETSPLRQSIVSGAEGYWSKLANTVVTNGPFMISNVDYANDSFTIVRNKGYHQSLSVKDTTKIVNPGMLVSFTSLGSGENALSYSDIEEKTVFYMGNASLEDRKNYEKKAKVNDMLSTYTYVFNMENPLFQIPQVRKALSLVISRDAIIEAITFGKAATGFLPDTVLNSKGKTFSEDIISTSANEAQARELLSQVDLSGLNKSITLSVNNDEESLAIANVVKAAWESLGFAVNVEALGYVVTPKGTVAEEAFYDSELQLLVKNASRGERSFDVVGIDWQMYSSDPFVALAAFSVAYSGCGVELPAATVRYGSFGGYFDAEYDALIKAAYEATDESDREAALRDAEKKLVESACIIPLVFNQNFAFVSRDISKLQVNGFGNFVLTELKQKNYRKYLN